jgi:hypothetical protein
MDETAAPLAQLIAAVEGSLDGAPVAEAATFRSGLHAVASAPVRAWPDAAAFDLPVCRFWDVALGVAAPRTLVEPLRALGPRLVWTQNPNYRRSPVAASFLDNYGYAVIAGPAAGAPALATCADMAMGVLLLGPGTHYPRHAHPARELYLPLDVGEWQQGDGEWTVQWPGAVIHHAPHVPHATRSGETPLLALYLWRGDLDTHARLT